MQEIPRLGQVRFVCGGSGAYFPYKFGGNVTRLLGEVQAKADPEAVKAALE
jgi:hypothetical protein